MCDRRIQLNACAVSTFNDAPTDLFRHVARVCDVRRTAIQAPGTGVVGTATLFRARNCAVSGVAGERASVTCEARDAYQVPRHTCCAEWPSALTSVTHVLVIAAVGRLRAGPTVLNTAEIVRSTCFEELGTALDAIGAALGSLARTAPFTRGIAGLARRAGETGLAIDSALLVADLLGVNALPVGAAGVTSGATRIAAAAVAAADLTTGPAPGRGLLCRLDALAELTRAAAILALLRAWFLFLLCISNCQPGHTTNNGE